MKKPLYLLFFLLFLSAGLLAQENDTVVVIEPPAVDTTVTYEDEAYEENTEVNSNYDTSLLYQQWFYPTDSIKHLRREKDFSYSSNLDSLLKRRQDELNRQQKKANKSAENVASAGIDIGAVLRVILWGLLIAALLFILYRVFLSDRGMFASPKKNKTIELEEEQLADDAYLDTLLQQAVKDGNHRLAIRYLYLQTLARLSDRGWLQLSPDKTNYQYLRELAKPQLKNGFARITLHYEYAWYGDFTIESEAYQQVKNEFDLFHQSIKQI